MSAFTDASRDARLKRAAGFQEEDFGARRRGIADSSDSDVDGETGRALRCLNVVSAWRSSGMLARTVYLDIHTSVTLRAGRAGWGVLWRWGSDVLRAISTWMGGLGWVGVGRGWWVGGGLMG